MNERTVFLTALEKENAAQRQAYLDQVCAGDAALRERVEALLRSHEREGKFLDMPAVEQLAAPGLRQDPSGSTEAEAPGTDDDGTTLDFVTPSDKPGSLGCLGHYDILEVIGKGGMGIVLRAFDEQLHRMVAIKVLAAQLATNATARRRFAREAQAAAAVSHDHIVTIHAVEETAAPLPYLVMQYVAGLSLQQRLDRDGPLELPEILRIGMQTASGLAAAHAQGLVHRDVKPANILLENGVERVKITDFGLARAMADANLTQSGVIAGTPHYMSPEQARGEPVDQRTDLFSLGSVLYAMCTGRTPFRGSNSMSVLKRVCDEAPPPIRETSPETPEWLVAIIDQLHAKDPAQRYQSAAEVAQLLSQHLAHVQLPSVAQLPMGVAGAESSKPPSLALAGASKAQPRPHKSRRLTIAAAVLLCFVGGLALTEATGVTNVRATVIRIFTPDGTLVVEVDDPGVKVTIEGDGGIVITGAGLEEIRLRPGSYKVQADRDGKRVPLERELVSIGKGGREVVRVKLEAPPASAAANAEKGAFVLLAAGKERKFDTLAEAVLTASDGDTIEIRGNGPFVTGPVRITVALNIRAASGTRPVIKLSAETSEAKAMIEADSPLVLEGLEFQRLAPKAKPRAYWHHVIVASKALYAANCRFRTQNVEVHVAAVGTHPTELRNCEFLTPATFTNTDGITQFTIAIHSWPGRGLALDNSLFTATGVFMGTPLEGPKGAVFRLSHNTCRSPRGMLAFSIRADQGDAKNFVEADWTVKVLEVQASDNVFDADATFVFGQQTKAAVPPGEAEALLARMVGWQGDRNVHTSDGAFLSLMRVSPTVALPPPKLPAGLAGWKQLWGTAEEGSVKGAVRFQGGDLLAKAESALEKITPDDFRLRPDSAGYRAGKDGKDLGADIDLVGPGPAYERWKKTPAYQQWLTDTKQTKVDPPTGERQAFVLLGGKGVAERKFDTLAEAVQTASEGDTIEVRGNGPFVMPPIAITVPALTIRAGEGFRPVIEASPPGLRPGVRLLSTKAPLIVEQSPNARLVLEGLEFRCVVRDGKTEDSNWNALLYASRSLHVANCRFLTKNTDVHIQTDAGPPVEVRNCEFLGPDLRAAIFPNPPMQSGPGVRIPRLVVDNCLLTAGVFVNYRLTSPRDGSIRLTGNTFNTFRTGYRGGAIRFALSSDHGSNFAESDWHVKQLRVEALGNLFETSPAFRLAQGLSKVIMPPEDAQGCLARMVSWRGERNLYAVNGAFLDVERPGPLPFEGPAKQITGLAGWRQFWGTSEADSVEGRVRYQGGDLHARLADAPEKLTPEDFRLRPDSAGYRAGKDGKDLGADVNLVGPGPAYERWKKTPEYQQWLKDTGQLKK